MDALLAVFLSFLGALTAVILLYIFVLPKKRNGTFSNGFAQWLHDYFRFKKLYIDSVLRFLFTFATFFLICYGIFGMITSIILYPDFALDAILQGLAITILGPIGLRLFYEMSMMLVMLVQNVMDINKKLDKFSMKAPDSVKVPVEKSEEEFASIFSNAAPSYQRPAPAKPAPAPAPVRPAPAQSAAPVRPAPAQPTAPIRPTPAQPAAPVRPAPAQPAAPVRPAPAPVNPTPAPAKPAPTQTIPPIFTSQEDDDATVSVGNAYRAKESFVGEEY